jgi:ABC-type lipoprotein release transport system permease subunit
MRVLASLLFHVATTDPLTFLAVTMFLAAIALLGCCIPARRAMRADPMVARRNE